jgi:hypothetical protein
MAPTKTTLKAAGKKNHKRLDHVPPIVRARFFFFRPQLTRYLQRFQNSFKPLRRHGYSCFISFFIWTTSHCTFLLPNSWHRNSPVANGPNIRDSRATRQITDGEGLPRSIASPELYAHQECPPVGMEIPVHDPSSIRYNPWGNTRQRPRNINLGSDESNFGNMTQVAEPDSQFATQIQYIPGGHVSQPAPQPNPYEFAFSQADLYSPDSHAGAQQPWTSVAPIYPIHHEVPYPANLTATFQLPEALPAATQNHHTVPPTSYPYNYPLSHFPNDGNFMPSHGSIATPSLQFAIPVQQAMPDTLPGNVEFYDYLPF